jgi:hypothetical protein
VLGPTDPLGRHGLFQPASDPQVPELFPEAANLRLHCPHIIAQTAPGCPDCTRVQTD